MERWWAALAIAGAGWLVGACGAGAGSVREGGAPAAASEAAPVGRTFELESNRVVVRDPITFEAGSARLTAESGPALDHLAAYLAEKGYISTLRIEGHVAEGDGAQALSEARALAVARALVSRGAECGRLLAVGFGATKPTADPGTPEGRARNTRIEAHNAALRGRPIGGMPLDGGGQVAGEVCAR